jgi:very-short-patch-repair endonuclease
VTVEPPRSNRRSADVVLHRASGLRDAVRNVDGVPVTCVERTLVDAWGHPANLAMHTVRAAVITAVGRRMCRPQDLAAELERRPQLRARASLVELVRLLAAGCRSELEIWGCLNVLQAPGMPRFSLQHRIVVSGRTFFLDAACEEVQLAVEMDGAAWHGSRDQREGDIRRDALLAAVGWQTLRFGFARMTGSPEGCRHEIRAVHAARLKLFRPNGAR